MADVEQGTTSEATVTAETAGEPEVDQENTSTSQVAGKTTSSASVS